MGTIRSRIAARDRDHFVGRSSELAMFAEALADRSPIRIVHVVGVGGIGKSALLREASRRAAAGGATTVWIDGRTVAPFPDEIERALAVVCEERPALVVFDSYELIGSLDSHLREQVIPELPDTTVVAFGSRSEPSPAWFEHGWEHVVAALRVGPLGPDDAFMLVASHGITETGMAAELATNGRGLPLALVVSASAAARTGIVASPDATLAEIADRLVGSEVEPAMRRILGVAALAKVTTPDLLADVLGATADHAASAQEDFKWLAGRTFAEPLAEGVALHALVADAVRAHLRRTDPAGEAELRRRIADHIHRRAVAGRHSLSADLQYLVVDQRVRWGFAADVGERYRIDRLRPGDADWIGELLRAGGHDDWWQLTRMFFEHHPETVGIARDGDGQVGGYFVAVSPRGAPPLAHDDPLLGPWLAYARDVLGTTSAVLWREAVDLTGQLGEITSLLGAGGILSAGVSNPRYAFLPIDPAIPAAQAFADALGARHVPEVDLNLHGHHLECYVVDFGPGGLLGFQRDWIYRETGAVASERLPIGELDPVALVRLLRDPGELAIGREWLGRTPSDRYATLRELVQGSLSVFATSEGERTDRAIIEAAYLADTAPHETIARRLHLSRTTYFRRLQHATERVAEEVLARLASGS